MRVLLIMSLGTDYYLSSPRFGISYAKTFCYNETVMYANIIKYYHIQVKYLKYFVLPYDKEQNVLIILMC